MSSEIITKNDLKAILDAVLPPVPKQIYRDSTSKAISTAGVDVTPVQGATVTLPAGHAYLIIGQWTFNTGSSSSTRNNQIVIKDITAGANRATQRVLYANQSFAVLQVMYITDILAADTTYAVCASSSMTYTTASNNNITAVPII